MHLSSFLDTEREFAHSLVFKGAPGQRGWPVQQGLQDIGSESLCLLLLRLICVLKQHSFYSQILSEKADSSVLGGQDW